MSTAEKSPAVVDNDNRMIEYVPFGEKTAIKLSRAIVRRVVAVPTKSGVLPSDSDIDKFILLCKARELNPFVGDAYLTGYDTKNGPAFSLITAIQALLKRAEANPNFDGMESGIVVIRGEEIIERPGNLVYPGERLFGGWARLWRKDRTHSFYDSLLLSAYKPPYFNPQWEKDGPGMIDKCAQASVLRAAFPSQLSALYIAQEMGQIEKGDVVEHAQPAIERVTTIAGLTKQLGNGSKAKATNEAHGDEPAGEGRRVEAEDHSQAAGQQAGHEAAKSEAEGEQREAPHVDGLGVIRAEFAKAKTVKAVEKLYDDALGEGSSAEWSIEQGRAIEAMRTEARQRIEKPAKQGDLLDKKAGAVEGGQ